MQKEYQQFRLKKPGGAGVKLFQAILAVNRDPGGTPVALPVVSVLKNNVKCVRIWVTVINRLFSEIGG